MLKMFFTTLSKCPKFAKPYIIQGQILLAVKDYSAAHAAYTAGIKAVPKDITLWVLGSVLEEVDGKSIRARVLIKKARPGSRRDLARPYRPKRNSHVCCRSVRARRAVINGDLGGRTAVA